jgi:hypothetical protein
MHCDLHSIGARQSVLCSYQSGPPSIPTADLHNAARRRVRQGQVRIRNRTYQNNGWLGIAGISIDTDGHIVSGYTKLNDTYFNSACYNDTAWKQNVARQELGHNIGLDHQDEDFDNESLKSCMDYQHPPWPDPNQHDYEQLTVVGVAYAQDYAWRPASNDNWFELELKGASPWIDVSSVAQA